MLHDVWTSSELCTQVVISPVCRLCRLVSGIPPSVDCTVEENASRLCDDGPCLPRSISIKSVPRGDSPAYTETIRLHQCSCRCWMSILPWCSSEPPIGRWCPPNVDSSVNADRRMGVMCRGCLASCVGSASFAPVGLTFNHTLRKAVCS